MTHNTSAIPPRTGCDRNTVAAKANQTGSKLNGSADCPKRTIEALLQPINREMTITIENTNVSRTKRSHPMRIRPVAAPSPLTSRSLSPIPLVSRTFTRCSRRAENSIQSETVAGTMQVSSTRSIVTRRQLNNTPSRLVAMAALSAGAALLFSAGSFWAIGQRATGVQKTRAEAHLILVAQQVEALLTSADATTTSGYLAGGLQDQTSQTQFATDIKTASELITELPRTTSPSLSTEGRARLTEVASGVTEYSRLAALAQANNRQGLPVGSTYQKQASALLRNSIVPDLQTIDTETRAALRDSLNQGSDLTRYLALFAVPFLLVSAAGLLWLNRLTNRTLNVGVAAALVLLLLVLSVSLATYSSLRRESLTFARNEFNRADLLRQATSSVFDARSSENQALIFRGNRSGYDAAWEASMLRALTVLRGFQFEGQGAAAIDKYRAAHDDAKTLDLGGNWDKARDSVLTGPSRQTFTALTSQIRIETEAVNGERFPPFESWRLRLITGFGGLLAAGLAISGYQRRLKEYR